MSDNLALAMVSLDLMIICTWQSKWAVRHSRSAFAGRASPVSKLPAVVPQTATWCLKRLGRLRCLANDLASLKTGAITITEASTSSLSGNLNERYWGRAHEMFGNEIIGRGQCSKCNYDGLSKRLRWRSRWSGPREIVFEVQQLKTTSYTIQYTFKIFLKELREAI